MLDPALAKVSDVVVQPSGNVSVVVELFTAACPQRVEMEEAARNAVQQMAWASECRVETRVLSPRSFMGSNAAPSLQGVGALIGISSCKGGVGKSTIAANLAFALAEMGGRVGLLDADVHGPSLPSLVALPDDSLPLLQRASDKLLVPPLVGGVKLMSYGFIAKGASSGKVSAAVMRGPMVGKVVGQMLSGTQWGELDYLLVDLPPGTGDVQLTLCQTYGLTAALVVTTPQKLARVDVEKGVDMFRELRVPVCAVVENMAFFTDPSGGVHHPFGTTQLERVRTYAGVGADDAVRLPIEADVSDACDEGSPLVIARPQSATAKILRAAAQRLTLTIARLQRPAAAADGSAGSGPAPQLRFDPKRGLVMRVLYGLDEGREFVLPRATLATLPGAPPASAAEGASKGARAIGALPAATSIGAAPDGAPAVVVRWEEGGESVLSLDEFKRLSEQQATAPLEEVMLPARGCGQ